MNPSWARLRLSHLALALVSLAGGCGPSEPEVYVPVDPAKLVPASGFVKVRGEPIAGAVVTLMNSSGIPSVGETGSDGRFALETASRKGALPGKYQVAISYMVSPAGKPQGLASRSAMVRSQEMREAVEVLPPEYSDSKKTKLTAEVGQQGANLDFDIPVTLELPKPKAQPDDAREPSSADKDAEGSQPPKHDAGAALSPKDPGSPANPIRKEPSKPEPQS